jgi:hypothetical protein
MVCLVERGGRCGPNGGERYDERMGRKLQATFTHKPNLPAFSRHSLAPRKSAYLSLATTTWYE